MRLPEPVSEIPVLTPARPEPASYATADEAVAAVIALYDGATAFLRERFGAVMDGAEVEGRYRAFYPRIQMTTQSFSRVDSRLAFGHVPDPGTYAATISRPDLFRNYLTQQLGLLIDNHGVSIQVDLSDTPIPLHFALPEGAHVEGSIEERIGRPLRDVFDVPDLNITNDAIVNGLAQPDEEGRRPLAPFTAQRVDYALARLAHYTATSPSHFQNHVLFT
ncbi:MAG: AMP nucleosidase, partial [Pseudomonadota bacterium]